VLTPLTVGELDYGFADAKATRTNPYAYLEIGTRRRPSRAREISPAQAAPCGFPGLKQGPRARLGRRAGLSLLRGTGACRAIRPMNLAQDLGGTGLSSKPHARWYAQPQGASFFQNFYDAPQEVMTAT